jgi:hypothetical protein
MLGIGGDRAQSLRHCPEQDVIDRGLILKRDSGDLVRHREHDVEARHVEQLRLTILQPLGPGEPWHFGQFLFRHELYATR